jgi:putative hemolysin
MEIFILALLVIVNGFFALSEIALVSSKKTRLEQMKADGDSGAKIAITLLGNSEAFLSAIQVGITLIGIVTGVYGGINIADDFAPYFENFEITRIYANEIALTVTVVVITYFSIVIGELVPKTIAMSNPEKIARKVAPAIHYFTIIFYPFVRLLAASTGLINKILGIKKQSDHMTEEELRQMIKTASHQGLIHKEQNIIHEQIFYFADKKAKHIMTHRVDVDWIDLDMTPDEIHNEIIKSRHNKLICCRGDLDHFEGVLYLKDYFLGLGKDVKTDIPKLLIQPLIVPENTEAQRILNMFKQKQKHFCVVVDEYGSFEGIITLHDIMESIIGEFPEAGEPYEPDVFVRDDNSILINGDAPIETLVGIIENFELDFDKIDYSTVAGFVVEQIKKIPKIGDKFEFSGYIIEILDIDNNRVDKILLRKKNNK